MASDNGNEKSLVDVLLETRDLIADPAHWTCGNWAMRKDDVISYCLEGALAVANELDIRDLWYEDQCTIGWSNEINNQLQRSAAYQLLVDIAERRYIIAVGTSLYGANDNHTHKNTLYRLIAS
jgi:hypothetical protein